MSRIQWTSRVRFYSADTACIATLLIVTIAVYAPALFGGKTLLPADIVPLMAPYAPSARERFPEFRFAQNQLHGPIFEYYSWRHYARERIRAGEVPLWNPYELSGNVLLANSQSAVLYPPNALLYLFTLPVGINLVTALHTFLTGFFLFGLLRARRLTAPASLTGALVWMFCGLQVVWTEFQTPTAALCWLPGILWMWELYAQGRGWRWAVFGAGAGIFLTLLAGHLHFAFYVLLAFALYAGAGVIRNRRMAAPLVGALAFGMFLSLVTLLPVMEMSRMNFRGTKTYADSVALAVPPANLLTLVLPNLFGNPRDYVAFTPEGAPVEGYPYWGKFDFIEYACYLGVPALILALVALFSMRHGATKGEGRSRGGVFLVVGVVGLLLALGTPLCALFFYGVPGYKQFNATARALCLFCFGFAALSAYGLDALMEPENRKRSLLRLSAATTVVVVMALTAFPGMGLVFGRMLTDQWMPYELAGLRHFGLFTLLAGGALWLSLRVGGSLWLIPGVAAADLLVWSAGFNPVTDPAMLDARSRTTEVLRHAAPARAVSFEEPGGGIKSFVAPNFNAVAGYREIQGADSLHTRRYHHLMERVALAINPVRNPPFPDPNTVRIPPGAHPVLDMLNLRYAATRAPLPSGVYALRESAELPIYENRNAYGGAWVSTDVRRIGSLDTMLSLLDSGADLRETALVEKVIPGIYPTGSTAGSARIAHFFAQRIEVDVNAPAGGILTLSEPFFPGWRASVDGRPAEVLTVNFILRGVKVAGGEQKVVFRYEPTSYRLGLYLTCVCAGIFTGFLAAPAMRMRQFSRDAADSG